MRKQHHIIFLVFLMTSVFLAAQPVCQVSSYSETANNEPIHHLMGILQDKNGMIWISSWGGLFSFDGVDFSAHKSGPRALQPSPTGDKWQHVAKIPELSFSDDYGTEWHINREGRLFYSDTKGNLVAYKNLPLFEGYRGCFLDKQNNLWILCTHGLHKIVFSQRKLQVFPQAENELVRCMYRFRNGDYWICQRNSKQIQMFDQEDRLIGYLAADGHISREATSFTSAVYSIIETPDGSIWLGTRQDGLYRLQRQSKQAFSIQQCSTQPQQVSIFDMEQDRHGRLWMASLEKGLLYLSNDLSIKEVPSYNHKSFSKAHNLYLHQDTLLVATSQGLVVADISCQNVKDIEFHYHTNHPERSESLRSNLCDFVLVDSQNRLFVCTENAGLNLCTSASLLEKELSFTPIDISDGLPDISFSLCENGEDLWMTSLFSISKLQVDAQGKAKVSFIGSKYLGERTQFVEIPPLKLREDKWLVATSQGLRVMNPKSMILSDFQPHITLTSLDIPGEEKLNYHHIPSSLEINPQQRSFKLEFAALDYRHPQDIYYAYRLKNIDSNWISLGNHRSISFTNIAPGKHLLEIKASNSDGIWSDNIFALPIHVKPKFSETIWATILLIFLFLTITGSIIYVVHYIRSIHRKHNEVLAAFLSIIGKQEITQSLLEKSIKMDEESEDFIKKLTEYINENLSNPELSVEDIAQHMAVSYSTLIRCTKSSMGITPGEFLSKARIRKASILLVKQRNLSISEIAYRCGFNDPRYFARCFKSETDMSPSEYRNKHREDTPHEED